MNAAPKPKRVMVVDGDRKFLDELKGDPKSEKHHPFLIWTGKNAQQAIAQNSQEIAGIFLNPSVITPEGGPNAISVVKFAHQHSPSVPVYLIADGECPWTKEEQTRLRIREVLPKPVPFTRMLELVAPHVIRFDPAALQGGGSGSKDALGEETQANDADFVPIRAADFVSGSKALFHVYIRLGPDKYVKLLHAGEAFSPERLIVYLKKGVESFYLRREDQGEYLAFCRQMALKVSANAGVSAIAKASQSLNYGQETMAFMRNQGLSAQNLHHAGGFIENIQGFLAKGDVKKNPIFDDFLGNLAAYDHGVSTSMVTALIAHVTGIESASVVQIVGMASLFHDIGLYQALPGLESEDESELTEEQKAAFYAHPRVGADMLSQLPGTHPSVIQAVLQHHERRGKKSFNPGMRSRNINRLAEILGIADDYLALIPRIKAQPDLDIRQELEEKVFPGFSSAVVDAFRSIFCKAK